MIVMACANTIPVDKAVEYILSQPDGESSPRKLVTSTNQILAH